MELFQSVSRITPHVFAVVIRISDSVEKPHELMLVLWLERLSS